jgi:hypothetical protein
VNGVIRRGKGGNQVFRIMNQTGWMEYMGGNRELQLLISQGIWKGMMGSHMLNEE